MKKSRFSQFIAVSSTVLVINCQKAPEPALTQNQQRDSCTISTETYLQRATDSSLADEVVRYNGATYYLNRYRAITYTYDRLGRISATYDSIWRDSYNHNGVYRLFYTYLNNQLTMTDGKGWTYTYPLDEQGQLVMNSQKTEFDLYGNLISTIDYNDTYRFVTTYGYDRSKPNLPARITYARQSKNLPVSIEYDLTDSNNATTNKHDVVLYEYRYDNAGKIISRLSMSRTTKNNSIFDSDQGLSKINYAYQCL